MGRTLRLIFSCLLLSICLTGTGSQSAQAANQIPSIKKYKSCKSLNEDYASGIAENRKKANAWAKKTSWLTPTVNGKLYKKNKRLDKNRNGVICEDKPYFKMPKYESPSTVYGYFLDVQACVYRIDNDRDSNTNWNFNNEAILPEYYKLLKGSDLAWSDSTYAYVYLRVKTSFDYDWRNYQKHQVKALNVIWDSNCR